jgi:osmotically-inducible protein OsmY
MKTDTEIQKNVMEELDWEPSLTSGEIGVSVKNGIVTLSGTVDSFMKKVSAEKAAKRVAGVKAVAEDIEISYTPEGKRTDTAIAEAVVNALKWHSAMQENKIRVKVDKGWVTLEGDVEWEFQRNSARYMVESLRGVTGISNLIRIKPSANAVDVTRQINAAFHRSATLDAGKISIGVNGTMVTLSGKVRSYAEKKDAENAAWKAPGVTEVENKIEIDSQVYAY